MVTQNFMAGLFSIGIKMFCCYIYFVCFIFILFSYFFNSQLWRFVFKKLICVYGCFACLYFCTLCVCLVPQEAPWNRSYRWLSPTTWVLGIDRGSYGRADSALNCLASSSACCIPSLSNNMLSITLSKYLVFNHSSTTRLSLLLNIY